MVIAKELSPPRTDHNTVIGESILISGKLTGDEDLTVRGRVEGELTLTRTLIVEPSGVVKANVAVKNAIVSGVVVGNINATESVELTREGRMVGDIRAPRVIIVDGASFRGRVDMGEVEPGRVNTERPSRPVVRPATRSVAPPPRAAPAPAPSTARAPAPPSRPDVRSRVMPAPQAARPVPPPPPPASPRVEVRAPVVADIGRKKVVVRKKGR